MCYVFLNKKTSHKNRGSSRQEQGTGDVASLIERLIRTFVFGLAIAISLALSVTSLRAAPYAAFVMDARSGEVLYSENADTRLHPASLTKMMTLYICFQEIERGNLSLDTMITVSKNAAAEPPSRLGLRPGQKIALRYLIRAAAVKSANDAAAAIGDAISGSPSEFGKRMTRTAKALGMNNSTFKNANGLTAEGHLSTAHDMSILGRHLFYDFPQYYNLFSRRSTDAGMATVNNTNRRFLDAYKGADGIKTGYTVAAGFNLTASAERDGKRLIATVFGGKSTADRNAHMSKLLDMGFKKAPRKAPINKPALPEYFGNDSVLVADNDLPEVADGAGKTLRVSMAMTTSPRPMARPTGAMAQTVAAAADAVDAMQSGIEGALAEAITPPADAQTEETQAEPVLALATLVPPSRPDAEVTDAAPDDLTATLPEVDLLNEDALAAAVAAADAPVENPAIVDPSGTEQTLADATEMDDSTTDAVLEPQDVQLASAAMVAPAPAKRNAPLFEAAAIRPKAKPLEEEIVISLSTSSDRHWGITLGRFGSRDAAERVLLKTQLVESATLNSSLRKVVPRGGGYEATFAGLTQDDADLACRRLQARAVQCFTMGP
jgi:D-alanyl-D-alanine carboxypeptidase